MFPVHEKSWPAQNKCTFARGFLKPNKIWSKRDEAAVKGKVYSSFFFVPEFENRLVSLINVAEAGGQGKKARKGVGGNNKASSPLSAAAAYV